MEGVGGTASVSDTDQWHERTDAIPILRSNEVNDDQFHPNKDEWRRGIVRTG
jgi:hypothetical protein